MQDHTTEQSSIKLCECGCGQKTTIWRGNPRRFCTGHNTAAPYMTLAEKLWQHVQRGQPNECWIWTGSTIRGGYGRFNFHGKRHLAHITAYLVTHSEIPLGKKVCHKCDNPPCCNPNHLWPGTTQDNMSDKTQKERQARGEKIKAAKLTTEQVLVIRQRVAQGEQQILLAKEYSVSRDCIYRIVYRETWTHI